MNPLAFSGGLTVWTLVTFGCLFVLLARFAFKPLTRLLEEREEKIARSLSDAEQANAEARDLLDANRRRLDEAREETRRIINEGHRIVADMKREGREKARQEAEHLMAQARTEIDRELQRSLDELKGTVAGLSVRIARQVIQTKLDETQHERLADEFVERLKKSHAGRSA